MSETNWQANTVDIPERNGTPEEVDSGGSGVARAAFRRGRAMFLDCQRVDMNVLAADLAINRVTLYRHVGSRQALLTDVLWSLARWSLQRNRDRSQKESDLWLTDALVGYITDWMTNPGCVYFMHEEPNLAIRLTTSPENYFHHKVLSTVQQFLTEQQRTVNKSGELPQRELAFVLVRIIESYAHIEYLSGAQSDISNLKTVLNGVVGSIAGLS